MKLFCNIDINTYLNDLIIDIKDEIKSGGAGNSDILTEIKIGSNMYKVMGRYVNFRNRDKKNKREYMVILYFIDDTENIKLQKEYRDSKSCVGIMMVDN